MSNSLSCRMKETHMYGDPLFARRMGPTRSLSVISVSKKLYPNDHHHHVNLPVAIHGVRLVYSVCENGRASIRVLDVDISISLRTALDSPSLQRGFAGK